MLKDSKKTGIIFFQNTKRSSPGQNYVISQYQDACQQLKTSHLAYLVWKNSKLFKFLYNFLGFCVFTTFFIAYLGYIKMQPRLAIQNGAKTRKKPKTSIVCNRP